MRDCSSLLAEHRCALLSSCAPVCVSAWGLHVLAVSSPIPHLPASPIAYSHPIQTAGLFTDTYNNETTSIGMLDILETIVPSWALLSWHLRNILHHSGGLHFSKSTCSPSSVVRHALFGWCSACWTCYATHIVFVSISWTFCVFNKIF